MNFKPRGPRLLIEKLSNESTTSSGLIIKSQDSTKYARGKVVAVGDGMRQPDGNIQPVLIPVGETVLFNPYPATAVTIDNKEYYILLENDVFGSFAE